MHVNILNMGVDVGLTKTVENALIVDFQSRGGTLVWSSAHALGGVSGVASFITTDEQLQ